MIYSVRDEGRFHPYLYGTTQASEGKRSLGLQFGKLALFQLSYTRNIRFRRLTHLPRTHHVVMDADLRLSTTENIRFELICPLRGLIV